MTTYKFVHSETSDFLNDITQSTEDYKKNILSTMCSVFINANAGWEYVDNGTYVNSNTTTNSSIKIYTVAIKNIHTNYHMRFWGLWGYNTNNYSSNYTYVNATSAAYSNTLAIGSSSNQVIYNKSNLLKTDNEQSYCYPGCLFYAISSTNIDADFGSPLNTATGLMPLDYYFTTSSQANRTEFLIALNSGTATFNGGKAKQFWGIFSDDGKYNVFGFGLKSYSRKYDRCIAFGDLISDTFVENDNNKFYLIHDNITSFTSSSNPSTQSIFSGQNAPSSTITWSNRYFASLSKDGTFANNTSLSLNTSLYVITPRNPTISDANYVNYSNLHAYLFSNNTESPLVENGQAQKGIINSDYIRYIDTNTFGSSNNVWRTFNNKEWILLASGYLFRFDPTATNIWIS